jgi:hypothetical protein
MLLRCETSFSFAPGPGSATSTRRPCARKRAVHEAPITPVPTTPTVLMAMSWYLMRVVLELNCSSSGKTSPASKDTGFDYLYSSIMVPEPHRRTLRSHRRACFHDTTTEPCVSSAPVEPIPRHVRSFVVACCGREQKLSHARRRSTWRPTGLITPLPEWPAGLMPPSNHILNLGI